ncbi:peroxisomal biogenesis factor 11 [Exidia glandulosa HHB12029]|uniref:Peroxisomal biogenesis factor 11 n=1 Tax=Exidia glandulosa HHB12029 TaxID=1314781 RepID=A0A165CPE9_EXIGL|nr:peroxisomal biogenesis factor 11 [Exidia glandulosa HHB12029]
MLQSATHVVLHPTAAQTVKVLSTTLGRDKIYRAVQYFARLLAWILLQQGNKLEAARWNSLKTHLALGRKLMRLFKPLEHCQAALRASQAPLLRTHPTEQYLAVARQLSYAGYLALDSVVWANTIRFVNLTPEKSTKYLKLSLRFWLSGIVFSLAQGVLKAGRLANEAKALRESSKPVAGEKDIAHEVELGTQLKMLKKERAAVRYQIVLDTLDVWIPATGLAYVNFNDGVVGFLGLVTSLMALRTSWNNARV